MDEREIVAVFILFVTIIAVLVRNNSIRGRNRRRWWVRPINSMNNRRQHGIYDNLFETLRLTDHEEFFEFTRMSVEKFHELLELVSPYLIKTSNRPPLPTALRLAVTLSYMAHGSTARYQSWIFRIGRSTAYAAISETCHAIWRALQPRVLPPMNEESWTRVTDEFMTNWQFPNCLGAVDGKHIRVRAPNKSGSISDGGVWSRSHFGQTLDEGNADIPQPRRLPSSNMVTNFAFVGDEEFPLKNFLMRPYSRRDIEDAERVFNYRLSRARRTIENAFGILCSRWQIFGKVLNGSPATVTAIVQATICLHNYIMMSEMEMEPANRRYCPPRFVDQDLGNQDVVEGLWRNEPDRYRIPGVTRMGANNATRDSGQQRNTHTHILRDYFLSETGERQVPWQYSRAFEGLVV